MNVSRLQQVAQAKIAALWPKTWVAPETKALQLCARVHYIITMPNQTYSI
jgi:hypothetical protein